MPTNLKLYHLMFIFTAAILVLTPCIHASISGRVVTPTGLGLRNAAGSLSEGSDARSVATNADTKIVFVSGRDGNAEIYVMNADGSGQTRLTYTPEDETFPAGSPDGLSIAFLRRYTPSGSYSVHVMNRDGTDVRVVPGAFADDPSSISWSPDSTRIAFANFGKINTIKVDGSGATILSPNGSRDFAPSWSPDGSWIAFGRAPLSVFDGGIFKMRPDGSETTPVVPGRGLRSPWWSPDGARIVFSYVIVGTLDDDQAIAFIENGLVVNVINDPNVLPDGAKYSPDGQKLIYFQTSRGSNFGRYQIV